MEDKKHICSLLLKTLQATRAGQDLERLDYEKLDNGDEVVRVGWKNAPSGMNVNVTADSGQALIRDIMRWVL